MILTIDIGNTSTILGVFKDGTCISNTFILTDTKKSQVHEHKIAAWLQKDAITPQDITGIGISSVVPQMDSIWTAVCQSLFKQKPLFITSTMNIPMQIAIDSPAELGSDILCDVVAAYNKVKKACIVVDLGTATVVSAITEEGKYSGSAIAPGIETSLHALTDNTALLKPIHLSFPKRAIGKNTTEALQSGILFGHLGLVKELITQFQKTLGTNTSVLLTGGYAEFLAPHLTATVEPHLTLEGIYEILTLNPSI